MGGERPERPPAFRLCSGSSPRGRGTRPGLPAKESKHRFIPAWAGNARAAAGTRAGASVHPRVGGERRRLGARYAQRSGSSPRGRGTPVSRASREWYPRFIPAWAGNAPRKPGSARCQPVHPRVGGERSTTGVSTLSANRSSPRGRGTLLGAALGWTGAGSSPRGRGTLGSHTVTDVERRFIPAWAGNANKVTPVSGKLSVHPRVGGERL